MMTIVLGHERPTETSASVAVAMTLSAIAVVSTRTMGVPMGTAARRMISATAPRGTPSTLTDRATRTGLNCTSQIPPASRASPPTNQAVTNQGRRRT